MQQLNKGWKIKKMRFFILICTIISIPFTFAKATVKDVDLRRKNHPDLLTNVDINPKEDISINMGIGVDTNMGVDTNQEASTRSIDHIDTDRETDEPPIESIDPDVQSKKAFSLNRQVLPKGIWHPRIMVGTVSEVSYLYSNTGVLTSIGRFNQTFNSEFLKKFDSRFEDLSTVLNKLTGTDIGEKINLGSLNFSGGPEVSYLGLVLAYGITDRWTIGVGLPIVNMYGSVAVEATGHNNISEIRKALPYSDRELSDIPIISEGYETDLMGGLQELEELQGQKLEEQFHQVVAEKGYKSIVNKPSSRDIGDIQIFSFYNYFNRYPWSFYLMVTANLPTGPKDDPDDLVDFPNFAQTGLLVKTYHQYQASRNVTLGGALSYYWRVPDQIVKRVPKNIDDILPDANRKELVDRNLGDITSIDTFGRYDIGNMISFSLGLSWSFQPSDIYRSQKFPSEQYLLEKDTESHWITGRIGISFSSLPWFQRGKFFIPLILAYNYSDTLYGRNVIREVKHEASLLLFF